MNPLTPQAYDVAFIALIIFNVILTIYVIALISAIDIRLAEKIFATCIVVSLPIIAPAMFIYTYFRRKC